MGDDQYADLNLLPLDSNTTDDYSDLNIPALETSHQPTNESRPIGEIAKSALSNLASVPSKVANYLKPENSYQNLPIAGAIIGSAVAPGVGTAAGAGLGQIASRMAGMAYGKEPLATSGPKEAIMPMVQTAIAGLPETSGIKNVAQNMGRRALGVTKGMIKRLPGGMQQANDAAQEMLNKGVIGPSVENTLERAQNLAQQSGQAIGNTLVNAGQNALDTNALGVEISNQLGSNLKGGAYDSQNRILGEILDTVGAHGNGPIDFQSAQTLKNTLKEMAGANWNTDNLRAAMYQRAYGIVNKAIEDGLQNAATAGTISQSAIPEYLANKKTYGASQIAIQGLRDKAAAEAANNILSLRGSMIGAGALASGHITPALEALGVWELAQRHGAGALAPALNSLINTPTRMIGTAMTQKIADYLSRYYQPQSYNK